VNVDRFAVLADPTRRRVLGTLAAQGGVGSTVAELAPQLGLGRSLVSYHLARLVGAGLATVSPDPADGRRRLYRSAVPTTPRRVTETPHAARHDGALRSLVPPARLPAADSVPAQAIRQAIRPNLAEGLAAPLRDSLARFLRKRRLVAGELLFSQGEPASGICFLASGAVRLYTADENGREQTLQVVCPGASFDEAPFFDRGPQPASAQAVEDSVVLMLPVERRDEILQEVPGLAIAAAASFAFRLRQTIALVEDLSFRQVAGRVGRVLLQAVEPHAGVGAGSSGLALTQREIAEMVGSSREVVARSLRQLEREGLIQIARGRITILDREGLVRHE
jgi:CRP/FNR family transcriptional regulator